MELDKILQKENEPRTEVQQKRQSEYKFIGSTKRHSGHILFQYNVVTGEIEQAKVTKDVVVSFVTKKAVHNPKVVIEKDCIYRQALNKRSLIKKLSKEGYTKFI